MKELFFPWNNWHAGVGGSFPAVYLDRNSGAPDKWPAASTAAFNRLTQANVLEDNLLMPALRRFSTCSRAVPCSAMSPPKAP